MTIIEAAARLNCSVHTIRKRIRQGDFTAIRIPIPRAVGYRLDIPACEVEAIYTQQHNGCVNVSEAAYWLGYSYSQINYRINKGYIQARKRHMGPGRNGFSYRIPREEIERLKGGFHQ